MSNLPFSGVSDHSVRVSQDEKDRFLQLQNPVEYAFRVLEKEEQKDLLNSPAAVRVPDIAYVPNKTGKGYDFSFSEFQLRFDSKTGREEAIEGCVDILKMYRRMQVLGAQRVHTEIDYDRLVISVKKDVFNTHLFDIKIEDIDPNCRIVIHEEYPGLKWFFIHSRNVFELFGNNVSPKAISLASDPSMALTYIAAMAENGSLSGMASHNATRLEVARKIIKQVEANRLANPDDIGKTAEAVNQFEYAQKRALENTTKRGIGAVFAKYLMLTL